MASGPLAVQINWIVGPFRADKFIELWTPAAESALRYGATGWALFRNTDGGLDFTQYGFFPGKEQWENYWYSEELSRHREAIMGMYDVPVVYTTHSIVGMGSLDAVPSDS